MTVGNRDRDAAVVFGCIAWRVVLDFVLFSGINDLFPRIVFRHRIEAEFPIVLFCNGSSILAAQINSLIFVRMFAYQLQFNLLRTQAVAIVIVIPRHCSGDPDGLGGMRQDEEFARFDIFFSFISLRSANLVGLRPVCSGNDGCP